MGKTYRKEKPSTKQRREDTDSARHGDKSINHAQERTQRKRLLKDIEHHWDEDYDDHG